MYELILYLKVYVKSEKTFQRSFKRLNVEKLVHNVLTFYRFNNLGWRTSAELDCILILGPHLPCEQCTAMRRQTSVGESVKCGLNP